MLDYDELAADYAAHRRVHPEVLCRLLALASAGGPILEVGCGTGNYLQALQQAAPGEYWGIDPSGGMLARARVQARSAVLALGRAEALPLAPRACRLLYSVDVIHHVSDRAAYFRDAFRVLQPGGRVCTVTDSEEIILGRSPLSTYFPETVPIELRRYPRIADLRRLMAEAGFVGLAEEVVSLEYPLRDIGPYRDRAFSSLQLLTEDAFRRGLARLEADLSAGPVPSVSRYILVTGTRPDAACPAPVVTARGEG